MGRGRATTRADDSRPLRAACELPDLLAHYRVRLVAFPSAGPETFSFTLSETWAAGLPVIVPPFGALAERVAGTGAGWLWTDAEWRDEAKMLARIVALVAPGNAAALRLGGGARTRAAAAHAPGDGGPHAAPLRRRRSSPSPEPLSRALRAGESARRGFVVCSTPPRGGASP